MDTDSFVSTVKTHDFISDLCNLDALFNFSNLNEESKLFRNENEKVVGKFKIQTLKNVWIDDFICLRDKA